MTNSTSIRIGAIGLVAGPLLFCAGDLLRRLVEPAGSPTASQITAAVSDHGAAWLLAGLLSVLAAFFLVPGAIALVATSHGRGARLTTVGGCLVGIGAIASVGHAVAFYAPYALFDDAGTSAAALKALDHSSEGYPLLVALIVLFIAGMMLGSIVLLIGLRRARRVPVWAVVAAVVFVVCGSTGGVPAGVIGLVAGLAAFVPASRALVPTSDLRDDRAEQLTHA